MTKIYFVRHAEPIHSWEDDRSRPLSNEGVSDSKKVTEFLKTIKVDCFYSSPYKRSIDTIFESSVFHGLKITTDERLRERKKGIEGNNHGMFQKRWGDFYFCEENGESLGVVQKRNMSALLEILAVENDKNIVIGTHGTSLSTILNYYNPKYGCNDFLRIIDFMPYIIRLDFINMEYIELEEMLIIKKPFSGDNRADKI